MVADWIICLHQRPADRTGEDIDIIYARLQDMKVFQRFHPVLLQQMCYYGYYEDLEEGIVLFRQGDIGTNWYAILKGTLDVIVSETGNIEDAVTICTLGPGKVFGESVLEDTPRNATVITSAFCEVLRVEKKDFRTIWERSKQYLEGIIFSGSQSNNAAQVKTTGNPAEHGNKVNEGNSTHSQMIRASLILRSLMLMSKGIKLLKDRKYNMKIVAQCFVGSEAVDWLLKRSRLVHSRFHALGMWQALLEEGTIAHVTHEYNFEDKSNMFYKFMDVTLPSSGENVSPFPTDCGALEDELEEITIMLSNVGPDAMFRAALRKDPEKRTQEDLDVISEELLHIKALLNFSTIVIKDLAAVFTLECHEQKNQTLFSQGTEANSWHIILKGSVNVVVYGKGIVCQLGIGDDFGKLALVNNAPRSASIVTCEENCQFLRVDKENFNKILRDVEVNTVRMKEGGKDVLVLKQVKTRNLFGESSVSKQTGYKYAVMAGTPEKMVEHLLEMRIENIEKHQNTFLFDFLLAFQLFMTSEALCIELLTKYHGNVLLDGQLDKTSQELGHSITVKKRVVQVILQWYKLASNLIVEDKRCFLLINELMSALEGDEMYDELNALSDMMLKNKEHTIDTSPMETSVPLPPRRSLSFNMGFRSLNAVQDGAERHKKIVAVTRPIKRDDYVIFKVYCADHTYVTLRMKYGDTAQTIIKTTEERVHFGHDCVLCEVKSNNEIIPFNADDMSVYTRLSVNGRLFIAPAEHIDSLTPLPEQERLGNGTFSTLEMFGSREMAYYLTEYDYELFTNINIYELIYLNFGRQNFDKITSNLDIFLRRFNEIHYWVITEICLTNQLSKRVHLLKKLIKIAMHCKEYRNWNAFFAIIMGLNNIVVSRLSQTWEKLPSKFRKVYAEFEASLDPSRNHRVYRLALAKMKPPTIPFMAILMKDMTFIHVANQNKCEDLINFEKMRMITSTVQLIEYCRSEAFAEPPPSTKHATEISTYIRTLRVNDNQRTLTHLSHNLESRK